MENCLIRQQDLTEFELLNLKVKFRSKQNVDAREIFKYKQD